MTEWIALSRTTHAGQTYKAREGYQHAEGQMLVPVLVAELAKVLPHYVIGFVKTEEGLSPMAVLGVEKGQNLYLHRDGRWLAKYVPASLRGFPFNLAKGQGKDKTLAIASEHLGEGDVPLFENGEPSESVAEMLTFLGQRVHNHELTLQATKRLEQAGVLTDWNLVVPVGEGHKQLRGLKGIDEQALNNLEDRVFAGLRGAPIQLAYAQVYSMAQIDQLTLRSQLHQKWDSNSKEDVDLEDLFGEDDDDLSFNF
ncbi:SapC family protein [Marinobacter sp. S6332]|uniref:SapC family protein n=1 Tax=Marinobacter sp. S6332 TaxID=2926403 RepID=UPI001FF4D1DF|nr:SapC family protein [Marinobacter sp. S6332]MCK0163731.1 SapC family protein [Marinobacter sp. S6332]